ncbi:GNAT family N-acetyltransferase [Streptomyces sp. NPDC127068]|uniref:GNAT family N-acetyltransferase n=1 Tax=Streptomyces sp. NPDC127068 TaxID=3347127 RepID=UPI0036628C59
MTRPVDREHPAVPAAPAAVGRHGGGGAQPAVPGPGRHAPDGPGPGRPPAGPDLLDGLADWRPAPTRAGVLRLLPVVLERHLALLSHWMNDPAVAAFWELSGPPSVTERHLGPQLAGDGRSIPCLGLLDGTPMSYWEVYRADLDPLARHYPARPHDTGVHLLVAGASRRGRGLGSLLLGAVSEQILRHRPACTRIVAEPDRRNAASVAAFRRAGFRLAAEVALPDKTAALMIRDRSPCAPP